MSLDCGYAGANSASLASGLAPDYSTRDQLRGGHCVGAVVLSRSCRRLNDSVLRVMLLARMQCNYSRFCDKRMIVLSLHATRCPILFKVRRPAHKHRRREPNHTAHIGEGRSSASTG